MTHPHDSPYPSLCTQVAVLTERVDTTLKELHSLKITIRWACGLIITALGILVPLLPKLMS